MQELSSSSLEIIMETIPEQQYKQRKNSLFKAKASEFMSALARVGATRHDSLPASGLPQTGLLRLPLSMLLHSGLGTKPSMEIGGKFLVKGFNHQRLGEVTLHIVPTPNAVVLGSPEAKPAGESQVIHQAYINYESDGDWKRSWALLTRDQLILRDIKHRKLATPTSINLTEIVKIDLVSGDGQLNSIGMENCLELAFEDGTEIFMYADNEIEAYNWADVISQAVWGQPFVSA